MPRNLPIMGLIAPLALSAPLLARVPQAQRLDDRFEHPDGLAVTLWAESPLLYNPTALDVDGAGRVWVAEAVNYRKWGGRNPGRSHPKGDRIVVLEDRDGDGVAEHSTVFAQDLELVAPLGLCVLPDGGVLVSCSPNLLLYRDTDGDLVSDSREVLLTGFGGLDHDHGLHSATPTYDGRLLLVMGNAGPHKVQDKDGWNLRSSSFYSGGSPRNSGMMSDDGRVHVGGLILRMDTDGGGMSVIADNFRNIYEATSDAFGRFYTEDNDDDGNRACRTLYVTEGGDYGYASADGSRGWAADERKGQERTTSHWHQDDPGVFPAGTINGAGGPTGVCIYEAGLPNDPMYGLNGAVLNADAGAGVIYAHFPMRKGASVELQASVLLGRGSINSDDPGGQATWFRPSDVAVAPDGSILVADWYDPGVGGHGAGDREAYGRILRIQAESLADSADARRLVLPPLEGVAKPFDELLDGLVSPAPAVRMAAFEGLAAAGDKAYEALHQLAGHSNPHQAARALYLLARLGTRGSSFVEQLFHQPIPELRVAAWRALLSAGVATKEHRARIVRDDDAFVRASAAQVLRDLPWAEAEEDLVALALRYEGSDRTYLEALGLAAEGKQAELYARMKQELGGDQLDWFRFAPIAWRLHPEGCVADLLPRIEDAEASLEQRKLLLDAIAFVPTRAAAEAMLNLALAGPKPLRNAAAEWFEQRSSTIWRTYGLRNQLATSSIENAVRVYQSPLLRSGSTPIDVRGLEQASYLWLVVDGGADGFAYDWADWIELAFEGSFGRISLAEQGWVKADTGWGQVRTGANCSGGPLVVDGVTYTDGIGTHADSAIGFQVPAGSVRLLGMAGPDQGGISQTGQSSMTFEVHLEGKAQDERWIELRKLVENGDLDISEREQAAMELVRSPGGGFVLVKLAQSGVLPEELRRSLAPSMHDSPDFALRALASGLFPREGREAEALPPLAEIVAISGDRLMGAELFFGQTAGCANCHRVRDRGGDIGPDLSAISQKYGRLEMLDAILNPSASIAHGYETWLVETVDGVLFAGRILADGEDLLLQDTAGRRHVIAAEDVDGRYLQERSTMPDNVATGLNSKDLANLLTFLSWTPNTEPEFEPEVFLFDGEHELKGWYPYLGDSKANPSDTWSVRDGILRCEGKPSGYMRTTATYGDFELRLQWRFDPAAGPGNSGVLLHVQSEDKLWPKSIKAELQHGHAGDIWNIDRVRMSVAEERTSGRHTQGRFPSSERPLGEWNDYRIRLYEGELELEVNGVIQNTASWCDETPGFIALESNGSVIEFRNIRLRPIAK